jgi:hypothetical protein
MRIAIKRIFQHKKEIDEMSPLRVVKKKMGQMLIERGVITPKQLRAALGKQKKYGGYISQHLIALNFATETDVAICLSNQYNFAYMPLKNYAISDEVLKLVPLKWVKIYTVLPLDKIGNIVSVAMADPLNDGVIQMLRQITGCEIAIFVSTYSELNEAIGKCYKDELNDLEKHHISRKDLEAVKTVSQFVQTKKYLGPDRRKYLRLKKELNIFFYYLSKKFQGRTRDISYGGVSFISEDKNYGGVSFFSNIFMPINVNLACRIILKPDEIAIDVVLNVLRVEIVRAEPAKTSLESPGQGYEIAGAFEFINIMDRENLLAFLKENIAHVDGSRSGGGKR